MEHPIGNLMDTTMNKIKEMVDVNTIVGERLPLPTVHSLFLFQR